MNILYENKDILIMLKGSGVPVQGDSSGEKSLADWASEHTSGEVYVITRLDRPVGGVVLFAKNKAAAAKLSKLLREHKITKIYYAVVCGTLSGSGKAEDYIMHNKLQNMSKIVNKGNVGAKYSLLEYEAIESRENLTLVKIKLITGRHHQIRVQLAHMGYPLYGDTKYNPAFRFKRGVQTALFASELAFEYEGEAIDVKAKPTEGIFNKF